MKNLLLINRNFNGTSVIYETDFNKELENNFNVFYYGEGYNNDLDKLLSSKSIDIVLCGANTNLEVFFNIKFNNKYLILSDLHKHPLGESSLEISDNIKKFNIKKVFLRSFNEAFISIDNAKLFTWSLNEDTYKFQEYNKKYDICFLGSKSKEYYPLRYTIHKNIKKLINKYNLSIIGGNRSRDAKYDNNFLYNYTQEKRSQIKVGDEYIKTLNNSKLMLFDSSIFRYPVKKYVECMATGCLILADEPLHSENLKLVEDYNYVKINKDNWIEKTLFYLNNDNERIRIINNARNTFISNHTNKIRIQELIRNIL